MGLYKRKWRRKDGQIVTTPIWWMNFVVENRQYCLSTGTENKQLAQKILNKRLGEIVEGRFQLPISNAPTLEQYSQQFLHSISHQVTKKRYTSSVRNLLQHLGDIPLHSITSDRIDHFKDARLAAKVRSATINRDLAVLRRMLKISVRKRLITVNPFREIEMLEERKQRRRAHILTFAEEEKILAVAPKHLRVLVILIVEAGLRSGKEALSLRWEDIDFASEVIRVKESKTAAGVRTVPMSSRCKSELVAWRSLLGSDFSEYVFANPRRPGTHLVSVRSSWSNTLKAAGLGYFWLYDLRSTFASRLTEAGVSPLFVSQLMGHASLSILHTYARAIDEYRRSSISKLEALREAQAVQSLNFHKQTDTSTIQ